jgi:hypothetical protein
MRESQAIALPKRMPVAERMVEANRQLSEWIGTLEEPYSEKNDALHMKDCKSNEAEYKYHYTIERNARAAGRILIGFTDRRENHDCYNTNQ